MVIALPTWRTTSTASIDGHWTSASSTLAFSGTSLPPRIPASAVVQRGEVSAVYVLADGRLSLRQLRLGARDGDSVEVIAGLKPGEAIATDPVAAMQALVAARQDGN